jgi:hypothetical protein
MDLGSLLVARQIWIGNHQNRVISTILRREGVDDTYSVDVKDCNSQKRYGVYDSKAIPQNISPAPGGR